MKNSQPLLTSLPTTMPGCLGSIDDFGSAKLQKLAPDSLFAHHVKTSDDWQMHSGVIPVRNMRDIAVMLVKGI